LTKYILIEYILTIMRERTLRQEQKDRTKAGLIRAASGLFARQGIAATTTAGIAKQLGVSHGTVFVHFPAREDLVLAVIDDFGEALSERLRSALRGQEGLEGVLRAHLAALAEFENFYFRLLTETHSLPGSVKGTLFMLNAAVSGKMYAAAKPLMKSGNIKRIGRPLFFNTWIALVQYYVSNREEFSDRLPILKEKEDVLIRHFLELVQT
jgi:AcrR family transcriptional regulator